ncbi:MAG TPA: hypothetical protein VFD92_08530 [Candidatus Binatia bacterium]|nr:hypothetical protein [Candidatus Binatia bacterium]
MKQSTHPVEVGSMLFTIVDPHVGHEVAYNRWYERDHFYAGCLVGPWLFSGGRWVATRAEKALRFPEDSPLAKPTVKAGSYVAIYWIHAGHHDDYQSWGNKQAHWLYQNGRGFNERTHVHTLLYTLDWVHYRDADPVPLPLALDHRFAGLATVAVLRAPGVPQERLDAWLRERYLREFLPGSPIAMCATWSPIPQGEAPMAIPKVENTDRLDMQLWFTDEPAASTWDRFRRYASDLAESGLGQVAFASPWRGTVIGTDRYTDELW